MSPHLHIFILNLPECFEVGEVVLDGRIYKFPPWQPSQRN